MNNESLAIKHRVSLSFEEIKLPPFQDILVLGKNNPQGKLGLSKSFELLAPNGFEVIEIEDENVEAVFVNRRILKKINKEKILPILQERVFPFVSEGELLKIDFSVTLFYTQIES